MVSRHFFLLFPLLTLRALGEPVDFSCPTADITEGIGFFPKNQNTSQRFPANYSCEIKFQIQDGYVVKFALSAANLTDTGDSLIVADAKGKLMTYTDGVNLFFAPARTASVYITSKSGNAEFWFRYEYVFVSDLENVQLPTGSALKLFLAPTKTYTFTSPHDHVVLHLSSVAKMNDSWLLMIYVYDGIDVQAPYLGTLYELVNSDATTRSSNSSLTLMNLYGVARFSWVLANDYSAISSFSTYQFMAFDSNVDLSRNLSNLAGSAAYTFLCTDCTESYLTELVLPDRGIEGQKVEFSPLTPTNNQKVLLTYKASDVTVFYMPQQIPGTLFTMILKAPEVSLKLSASSPILWKFPFDGRKGTIFSPSLWQPGQGTAAYNHTFESSYTMTFSFNLQSVVMSTAGEKILVRVGSSSGSATPFDTVFTKSVSNPGVRVANGTYMMATYSGDSPQSSSILTFEMKGGPGGPSGASTTVAGQVETTTKTARTIASSAVIFFTALLSLSLI